MKTVLAVLLAVNAGFAAGAVYVRADRGLVVLGNDFLERTISVADVDVGTRALVNKISGRSYSLRGAEFEARLNYERVGYSFGNENPRVVTATGAKVASQSIDDVAGGGKRVTLHLAPIRGVAVDLIYELKPDDYYTRQWVHIGKPQQGTYFVDWLAPAKNEWGAARFSMGGFGQPVFAEDLFLGEEYPSSVNTAEGEEVTLGGSIGLNVGDGGFTS